MVWYVPPLSPVMGMIEGEGSEADPDDVFPAIDELRIPIAYLANLLAAGDEAPVRLALKRLAAMRAIMRERNLGAEPDARLARGGRARPRASSSGSTGCSRSPTTTSATSSRRATPRSPGRCRGAGAAGGFPQPLAQPTHAAAHAFVPLGKLGRIGA